MATTTKQRSLVGDNLMFSRAGLAPNWRIASVVTGYKQFSFPVRATDRETVSISSRTDVPKQPRSKSGHGMPCPY